MSEFLLVVPPGWTQLDWDFISANDTNMNVTNVDNWCTTSQFSYIEEPLKAMGLIPQDKTVIGAKLIDGSFFAVLLA